jgi:hypothetical protein
MSGRSGTVGPGQNIEDLLIASEVGLDHQMPIGHRDHAQAQVLLAPGHSLTAPPVLPIVVGKASIPTRRRTKGDPRPVQFNWADALNPRAAGAED